jgi:uncharacterized RDD family membrane protein YckC
VFCSKCGAALAAGAGFCTTCGTPVGQVAYAGPPAAIVSPHASVGAIVYATNVVYAGFWLRFVAYLIDKLILGIATLALFIPMFLMFGGLAALESVSRSNFERFGPGQAAGFLTLILSFVFAAVIAHWLYFAYLESGEKQGTWGKQLMSVYVTDLSGNRIRFAQASGRFFARIITGLIPLGIGYIMAGFTERKQALHDMIAGCLVLRR